MQLRDVVAQRRMVRRYDPTRPVSRETVTALLDLAVQAPSAGFSQGWHFLVLAARGDTDRYWTATARPGPPDAWLVGMRTAPVVVLVLADPGRYRARYALPDKADSPAATTGAGPAATDLAHWPVPWWDVDAGLAALLILLGAVDAGLAGCLTGVPPDRAATVRAAFAIPPSFRLVAALTLGYPTAGTPVRRRPRRPAAEVVSYGRFGSS